MMRKDALENVEEVIKAGGDLEKVIKYADLHGMVAITEAELQRLLDYLDTTATQYDMKINIKNTKAMVISRNVEERMNY